jgi:hypothetical protein
MSIVNGVYKPTYNWGAPSCSFFWEDCVFSGFISRSVWNLWGGWAGPSWPVKPPCAWDCSYGGTRTKNSFHPESTHEEDQSIKVDQPVSELLELVLGTVLLVQNSSFSDDLPMTFRRMFQCSLVRWEKTQVGSARNWLAHLHGQMGETCPASRSRLTRCGIAWKSTDFGCFHGATPKWVV